MIRPHSLDQDTIERLRHLVAATYGGRNDLYAAAGSLSDEDLSAICRKLADNLAAHSATLEQIIVMQGAEPGTAESVTHVLRDEIMKFLRQKGRDAAIVAEAKKEHSDLRQHYDAAIAATPDEEAQAILRRQKEDVEFGERVLGKVAPPNAPPAEHEEQISKD